MLERRSNKKGVEGGWVGFAEHIRPLVTEFGSMPVFVQVEKPFWRRPDYRTNTPLPVQRIEVSEDTWEICVRALGLIRENSPDGPAITFQRFFQELTDNAERKEHCELVLSDDRGMSTGELQVLTERRGHEWSGVPLDTIEPHEELMVRLDLPLKSIAVQIDRTNNRVLFRVRV